MGTGSILFLELPCRPSHFVANIVQAADICDEKYKNLEWKVVDVGYFFTEGNWRKETLIIRLRDRLNHEMLFVYDRRDVEHGLKILRKAKNTVNEYNINVN